MDIQAFIKQPSTILGLGTLAGTIGGIVAHILTHDTTVTAGVGAIAFAAVHVFMPDNSAAPSAVEKLATDAITAIMQKRLAAAMPLLFADTVAVVDAFKTTSATVTAPTAPTPTP